MKPVLVQISAGCIFAIISLDVKTIKTKPPKAQENRCYMPEKDIETAVFVVRTTIGQETNVAALLEAQARTRKLPIRAILVPDGVKGYVFVEAPEHRIVEQAISGIAHVRGGTIGKVTEQEINSFLVPKKPTEGLAIGDIVEITGGPFKNEKARVGRIDSEKEEVVLELLETPYNPIPVKVKADYVRIVEKGQVPKEKAEEEEEEEEGFA